MTSTECSSLESTYAEAFQHYTDRQLNDAITRYLQDGDFFPPRPKELIKFIEEKSQDKHTQELIDDFTCCLCHQKVSAISDGMCLDCKGIPRIEVQELYHHQPQRPYRIEGRIKCQVCGTVGMCIQDKGDEHWQCVNCYSGLTAPQRAGRFRDLIQVLDDKTFSPNWSHL